jgi:transcriptional regulator with XRE-family HTH domain
MTSTDPKLLAIITRIRSTMKEWGVTNSDLATVLGVSRQYLWQVVNRRVHLSMVRATEIEAVLNRLVADSRRNSTFGDRLRAARRSAGFTLKEVASMIGYSWAGVERWEKDQCRPKPGVLFHLMSIYNSSGALLREPSVAVHNEAGASFAGVGLAALPPGSPGGYQLSLHTRAESHSPALPFGTDGSLLDLPPARRKSPAGMSRPRRAV